MSVGMLDHFNIRTRKLADTVRFYEDSRADKRATGRTSRFRAPGCTARASRWFISSIFRRPHEQQKPDSGVVHHVAFASRDFTGMKQRLQSKGLTFDVREVPGGELWQIFVNDPNGVMIELNYEAAKERGLIAATTGMRRLRPDAVP